MTANDFLNCFQPKIVFQTDPLPYLLPCQHRQKAAHDLDYGRSDDDHEDGRKYKHHHDRYHFDRQLGCAFPGALSSLETKRIGKHSQGCPSTSAEAVGLTENGD